MDNLRKYGEAPYNIAVIHGGPGAAGEMAPVARELSTRLSVLEPLQKASTVEEQVKELYVTLKLNAQFPVTLIGWSWGAWLSFIFTAEHPGLVKKLLIIDSGPFNKESASGIMETRLERLSKDDRFEALAVMKALNDPDTENKNIFLARLGELLKEADSYNATLHDDEVLEYSYDVYESIWEEARELRNTGALLGLGKKIDCPVVAIHGSCDPHPAEGVREPLSGTLKDFKFILVEKCGHYPWFEKEAKKNFFDILTTELS
ncbi:MAG: alpha/beta hydrolase [Actinobacteria bacterium]|nr:alpha/beta hydrolase [Actinomycetota bacterium]